MQKMKATFGDLLSASVNLSSGDIADFEAMQTGRNPIDVITGALDETTYAIKLDHNVLAVGGHTNGGIWFVTTNVITTLSPGQ
ncbi:hypothetical protein, partial [Pseudomonas amygdali]